MYLMWWMEGWNSNQLDRKMLRFPFEGGDKSEQRVEKVAQLYKELEEMKFKKDGDIFREEVTKLHNYSEEIQEILALVTGYQGAAKESIRDLDDQLNSLHLLKHKMEGELADLQKSHTLEKTQYNDLKAQYIFKKKQRIAISESLNLKPLLALQIEDRKAECHQIFIWILSVVYKEPSGKYYWENFKQQAFGEDEGVDFVQRIGRMSVTDLREEERIATEKMVGNRGRLEGAGEFQGEGVMREVKKIIDVAQLFIDGYEISKKSKQLDKEDSQAKDQRVLKQESIAKIKAKLNAVQDRKNLNIKYSRSLESIESQLKAKQSSNSKIELNGLKVIREIQSFENGKGDLNSVSLHQEFQRRQEQCLLF